jgi:hypothetical protein
MTPPYSLSRDISAVMVPSNWAPGDAAWTNVGAWLSCAGTIWGGCTGGRGLLWGLLWACFGNCLGRTWTVSEIDSSTVSSTVLASIGSVWRHCCIVRWLRGCFVSRCFCGSESWSHRSSQWGLTRFYYKAITMLMHCDRRVDYDTNGRSKEHTFLYRSNCNAVLSFAMFVFRTLYCYAHCFEEVVWWLSGIVMGTMLLKNNYFQGGIVLVGTLTLQGYIYEWMSVCYVDI